MATFDWATCTIDMSDRADQATMAALPADAQATVSCTHEYTHFLQSMGSYGSFAMMSELLEIATIGALLLQGVIHGQSAVVHGYHPILACLSGQRDHAGSTLIIRPRLDSLLDEARAVLMPQVVAYNGAQQLWDIDTATISSGTFVDAFDGVVTASGFRPFNVAFLAENMARQMDRWIARNHTFQHTWRPSDDERDLYNGLRHVLSQPRYAGNVTASTVERVLVIVCSLGITSPQPDRATRAMLDRLARGPSCGGLPQTVAIELADTLVGQDLLGADPFNVIMAKLQHGPTRSMNRLEYVGVYEQLKKLRGVVNIVLKSPDYFARDTIDWSGIVGWMARFGLPLVDASDGSVQNVGGVAPEDHISTLMRHTLRVLS